MPISGPELGHLKICYWPMHVNYYDYMRESSTVFWRTVYLPLSVVLVRCHRLQDLLVLQGTTNSTRKMSQAYAFYCINQLQLQLNSRRWKVYKVQWKCKCDPFHSWPSQTQSRLAQPKLRYIQQGRQEHRDPTDTRRSFQHWVLYSLVLVFYTDYDRETEVGTRIVCSNLPTPE